MMNTKTHKILVIVSIISLFGCSDTGNGGPARDRFSSDSASQAELDTTTKGDSFSPSGADTALGNATVHDTEVASDKPVDDAATEVEGTASDDDTSLSADSEREHDTGTKHPEDSSIETTPDTDTETESLPDSDAGTDSEWTTEAGSTVGADDAGLQGGWPDGKYISVDEVYEKVRTRESGMLLINVVDAAFYDLGHIEGSLEITWDSLEDHLDEIEPTRHIIIYCRRGVRSESAYATLIDHDFPMVWVMEGGIEAWTTRGYPVVSD